jgi:hypothetical protein
MISTSGVTADPITTAYYALLGVLAALVIAGALASLASVIIWRGK